MRRKWSELWVICRAITPNWPKNYAFVRIWGILIFKYQKSRLALSYPINPSKKTHLILISIWPESDLLICMYQKTRLFQSYPIHPSKKKNFWHVIISFWLPKDYILISFTAFWHLVMTPNIIPMSSMTYPHQTMKFSNLHNHTISKLSYDPAPIHFDSIITSFSVLLPILTSQWSHTDFS